MPFLAVLDGLLSSCLAFLPADPFWASYVLVFQRLRVVSSAGEDGRIIELPVWKNAEMETYGGDGLSGPTPCDVRIGDGSIAVSYVGGSGYVVYEGPELGPGHFKLVATAVKGRATLHQSPGEYVLEGWWHEDGYEGMWRIDLEP